MSEIHRPITSRLIAKKKAFIGPEILNRYTSLPIALDVLSQKRITLLSPETWEDRNDAYYLERYRVKKELCCVLAICFSIRPETFHHWRVFSSGSAGVCIEFDKTKLLRSIANMKGFRSAKVNYPLAFSFSFQKIKPNLEIWPFMKRTAFKDEGEFRIVYESETEHLRSKHVDIDLAAIRRVTLSPWLPQPVAESVTSIIRGIAGCSQLPVNHSELLDNAAWRKLIE